MDAKAKKEDLYPSRIEAEPRILPRLDPVVRARESLPPGPISKADLDDFERDGFLAAPELFDESEVEAVLAELSALAERPDVLASEPAIREPGSGRLRSLFAIHRLGGLLGALARDPRILNTVRAILGDEVYIHQSRANLKPGFRGKEFHWHSDFETWHVEDGMPRMRAVSVSIALTENNEFNGPLMLVPGSHRRYVACVGETPEDHYKESLRRQEYGVPDEASLRELVDSGGIVAPKGPPGSVVFFDCNAMHGSNGNISPFPRTNAFFVFNAVSNTLESPFGGRKPRPEFVATRESFAPLRPAPEGLLAAAG